MRLPRLHALLPGLLAVAASLPLGGCFWSRETVNEPLDALTLAQLRPGKTTAQDAVALLGGPNEVIQLGRRSAYRYDYSQLKQAGFTVIVLTFINRDTREDRAWLFFDENQVLSHYGTTLSGARAEFVMPWQKLDNGPQNEPGEASAPETSSADSSAPAVDPR